MNQKEDCLFCKIVRGEIPSHKVYEDEAFVAFLDINPVNPGHTLIVPKEHSENILDMSEAPLTGIGAIIQKIARAVKTATEADGINVTMNNGQAAGQLVPHAHTHVIPRISADGYEQWKGKVKPTDEEFTATKEKIIENL